MVVVAADVVVDAFVGDVACCGRDGWWWSSRTSLSTRSWVTWRVHDVAGGGDGSGRRCRRVRG